MSRQMVKRASKRNSGGDIIPSESLTSNLGFTCLPLSPAQLRDVWDFDNECAAQLGAPLRTCSSVEKDDTEGVSAAELACLKDTIQEMWERAKRVFEIFWDPNRPDLGYRLRVKLSFPIKVTLKSEDSFYLGWCARTPPPSSPCSHLYQRSPVDQGYLGGPASFCNWAAGKVKTANMTRPTTCSARYLVRLECRNVSAGTEITWNYGSEKEMPIPGDVWFLDKCCSVLKDAGRRHEKKSNLVPFMNIEKCVLCGQAFANDNKEARVQRKPHFINSHADFLGSGWKALDKPYMQEDVDSLKLLTEADKLNHLLSSLQKDLKWHVIPACTVMSSAEIEEYGENSEQLMEEFKKRCRILRTSGTLVLRGMMATDRDPNFSPYHLKPIKTSVWRTLSWSKINGPPPKGHYGVPKNIKDAQTEELQSALLNFCLKSL